MDIWEEIKSSRGCIWKIEQEGFNPQSVHTLYRGGAMGGAMDNFKTVVGPQIWVPN